MIKFKQALAFTLAFAGYVAVKTVYSIPTEPVEIILQTL